MKKVILTGINGQLGQAIKKKLLLNNFIVLGIDLEKNNDVKNNHNFICDITDENQVNNFYKQLISKNITPDYLINNAGIGVYGNILERKESEIKKVMNVNLLGTINMIKFFIKNNNSNNKSLKKIINISSVYGNFVPDFEIYKDDNSRYSSEIYCATKAGITHITKYFAKNLTGKNIIINTISPGGIQNDKLQSEIFIKNYVNNVPSKRMANVSDIVEPLFFLLSDKANYINGQNIIIDGGMSC